MLIISWKLSVLFLHFLERPSQTPQKLCYCKALRYLWPSYTTEFLATSTTPFLSPCCQLPSVTLMTFHRYGSMRPVSRMPWLPSCLLCLPYRCAFSRDGSSVLPGTSQERFVSFRIPELDGASPARARGKVGAPNSQPHTGCVVSVKVLQGNR